MKKLLFFLLIVFIICINQNILAEHEENEFGIVNAWYNGQEATVRDVQLKINEPAEIRIDVTSKINGHVAIYLDKPLVTDSYKVLNGPSQIDKRIDALNVEPGWFKTYSWTIAPTGKWTNGNAPINLFVQFTKAHDEYEHVEFTIANPYILNEYYSSSGSTPAPTTTGPSSSDELPSSGTPGFGAAAALLGVVLGVIRWRRG